MKSKIENKELGFGKNSNKDFRFINRDGGINVKRKGLPVFRPYDLFHALITMGWGQFLALTTLSFFLTNCGFAFLYMLGDDGSITALNNQEFFSEFWDSFFFSVQTITTVGYGYMSPSTGLAKLISSVESFIGLLGIALVTGLLYGRFSRPVAKIRYAKNAVIAPFKDGKAFMMKMANRRSSKLIESEVTMVLSVTKETGRVNLPMKLDLKKINFFALSWVVVHPIDNESPFNELTQEELEQGNAEVIILLKAFDDTFSQTVYSRMSYKHDEIVWNAKYISSIGAEGSQLTIDLDRIDDIEILA